MTTNFDLAPPVVTVDGLLAVPVDIQQIDVTLSFDGALSTGAGDATLQFTTGAQAGNPIFDVRQTVTGVWLDGTALAVSQFGHHDFGGGVDSDLRVLAVNLPASTMHTLRVTYSLGPPQASPAGAYQPAMTWTTGPRLTFNFGFTDLGAGRYLEAWVPANLIYDQFALNLRLDILNTTVPHSIITNGTATAVGTNQWTVAFPPRFTAFSPLLEVRASDTVSFASDAVMLPVSGATVTIEAWKPATNPASLATSIASLKGWLADNENTVGSYLHGSRFVALINIGGMEYDGGTTTSSTSLRHETYHSWWGRGVKPASQPDAWWDEGWNVYHDNGGAGSLPFDFTLPPVTLRPANPWIRITASNAYTDGERFFRGVAAAVGISNLQAYMKEFFNEFHDRPVTTAQLEAFIVARSGNTTLVDACHRFAYGFPDPSSPPDLWMRDDASHTGADYYAGTFWDSPDLWVRNSDDGGLASEAPEYGQDNWFYARIRNRGTSSARHFLVSFNVVPYAGTEFIYPGDFLPSITAVADFELEVGDTRIVKAKWPAAKVLPAGTHACLLAAVITRGDHPVGGRHVWEHNNLAQKNLTIVDLVPGDWIVIPFVINRFAFNERDPVTLEFVRPVGHDALEAALLHRSKEIFVDHPDDVIVNHGHDKKARDILDCGGRPARDVTGIYEMWTSQAPNAQAADHFHPSYEARFPHGEDSRISVALRRGYPVVLGLRVTVPPRTSVPTVARCHLRHRVGNRVIGGLALEIRTVKQYPATKVKAARTEGLRE